MLSGQDKVATDVAVVKWMIETARPLTSSGHPAFHDMMWAASGGRYKGPCYSTVSNILAQLASDGKRECKRFINQLEEGGHPDRGPDYRLSALLSISLNEPVTCLSHSTEHDISYRTGYR
jgi:hypothetical protein